MSARAPFRPLAGGLTALALVVAPLNFGSTRPDAAWVLVGVIGAAGLCWLTGHSLERRPPPMPLPVLLGLAALALSSGWWLMNADQATAPAAFTLSHFNRILERWPASVMNPTAGSALALQAAFGLALWIVADLSRERPWLIVFSAAIIGAATVVAFLAVLQNQTLARGIFWLNEGRMPGRFWGTFFHHTAAGAYLNSAWPLAAGLALALRRNARTATWWGAALLTALATFFLLGAHTTHVARFSSAAAVLGLGYLGWKFHRAGLLTVGPWIFALPVAVLTVAFSGGRGTEIAQRWQLIKPAAPTAPLPRPPESEWPALVRADLLIPNRYNTGVFSDRSEAQRTAWHAIGERPWTGHGPANWRAAASRHSTDPYVRTFYLYQQFTHEDFLQTWVERGFFALVSLVLLLPGAALRILGRSQWPHSAEGLIRGGAATALALILAQSLLDFPLQIPAVGLNAAVLAGLCWSFRPVVNRALAPLPVST